MRGQSDAAWPEVGATASADMIVASSDLASDLRLGADEDFPPVLATSRMVALMEVAAARLLAPYLPAGRQSVGVTVDVVHSAATPQGAAVRAIARYLGIDGKLHRFEIVATDASGEVGRAEHRRAVVSTERLLAGARRRNAASEPV